MTITTTQPGTEANQRQLVQVWFGSTVIASHIAAPVEAARYAELMGKRFAGLKITTGPAPDNETGEPLPHPALWDRPPI
jgi:hypothetical protein